MRVHHINQFILLVLTPHGNMLCLNFLCIEILMKLPGSIHTSLQAYLQIYDLLIFVSALSEDPARGVKV